MKHEIKLSSEQLVSLLKIIYSGEWLINAHRNKPIKEFEEISDLFFSLAKDLDNISDKDSPEYPTNDFENGEVRDFINEYDNNTFWDELIGHLVNQKFYSDYSTNQIKKMSRMKRFKILCELEDKFTQHIEKNGLSQIVLDE